MKIGISQLAFEYPHGGFRLDIPELEIESGSRVAFVGPSGSGKTTLLRLLAGIYLPGNGSLSLDTVKISGLGDAARRKFRITRIGFVFQDFQLLDYLNVEENIRLPFRIHPSLQWSRDVERRLEQLTVKTGIADKRKRPVDKLSHGEKQRVALCRALLTRPTLILADEPTGNLDPAAKQRILTILFEETLKHRATLIMVTHDQDLLQGFQQVINFQTFQSPLVE